MPFRINDILAGITSPDDAKGWPAPQTLWDELLLRVAEQRGALDANEQWGKLQNVTGSLVGANHAVNDMITYKRDYVADRWKTPLETLEDEEGDCEDFAILKYFLLREKFPEAQVLLLRGLDDMHEDHALLKVGDHYLDNRVAWLLQQADIFGYEVAATLTIEA